MNIIQLAIEVMAVRLTVLPRKSLSTGTGSTLLPEVAERRLPWLERASRFLHGIKVEFAELRYDMIQAKKAAGKTGWWSDRQDYWAEEEFAARRRLARSKGWWWELQDQPAADEHSSSR